MTPLQEYVSQNGYADIGEKLGISVYEHPTLPLVGFKYSQIDSPKTDTVVRWSRGTVLEKGTWKLIAQPFVRFFNYGENVEELKTFDWSDLTVTSKEDGSLAIVYFYAGEWQMNTSGSFALGNYDAWSNETWRSLFWKTFENNGGRKDKLDPEYSYIFELCTMQNKVIRMYPKGTVFMLSRFKGDVESPWCDTVKAASEIGVQTATTYQFKSIEDVEDHLMIQEKADASYEGVVIRDKNNVRFKVKSKSYLALHHLHDNGNVSRTDRLVQLALANEGDEVLVYLPELKDRYREIKGILDAEYLEMKDLWNKNKHIDDKKTFALAVKDHRYSAILFGMKKLSPEQRTDHELAKAWSGAGDLIMKRWPKESLPVAAVVGPQSPLE